VVGDGASIAPGVRVTGPASIDTGEHVAETAEVAS